MIREGINILHFRAGTCLRTWILNYYNLILSFLYLQTSRRKYAVSCIQSLHLFMYHTKQLLQRTIWMVNYRLVKIITLQQQQRRRRRRHRGRPNRWRLHLPIWALPTLSRCWLVKEEIAINRMDSILI